MTSDTPQSTPPGFSGDIDRVRLIDVIQLSCLALLSHTIRVGSPHGGGTIHIASGQIIHAEAGELTGETAFYEMLRWDSGCFDTLPLPQNVVPSIHKTWEYLLIEAMRSDTSRADPDVQSSESGVKAPKRTFAGTVHRMKLVDLVQLICMTRMDHRIDVEFGEESGSIQVRSGQVVHAQTGEHQGEEAFFRMFQASSGHVAIRHTREEPTVSIAKPWEYLLIDAMRSVDEKAGTSDEQHDEESESLTQRIQRMKISEKIRLAMTGDKEARTLLIRDSNRMVQLAIINNPRITDGEVALIAYSRNVDEEVLRKIAGTREWIKNYPTRLALATNPKTPLPIATKLVPSLTPADLKQVAKSKSVPTAVAAMARRLITMKG